ncbi:MAG: tetratricopeptide repeat protein [Candidatus Thermoplasmatota archaeon]|nr:tetratricopeptide repeat protein [Candidatus Thermoplasmatota archaeon]
MNLLKERTMEGGRTSRKDPPFEEGGGCLMCGSSSPSGPVCEGCVGKFPRDDLTSINTIFLIATFCMAISLFIHASGPIMGDHYSETMERSSWMVFPMLFLSLLGSGAIIYQTRALSFGKEPMLTLSFIMGMLVVSSSLSYVLNAKPRADSSTIAIIFLISGLAAVIASALGIKKVRIDRLFLPVLGFMPSFFGLTRIMLDKPDIVDHWMLRNETLLLIGMVMTFSIMAINMSSSAFPLRRSMPSLIWSSGVLVSAVSLCTLRIVGPIRVFEISAAAGILLLIAGMGSIVSLRSLDLKMQHELKAVSRALIRADDMHRSGKDHYALQQVDRAIELNPVNGFGMSSGSDNILFKMDRGRSLREIIFEPGEYEIAFNERGKVLASQGKYPEAIKAFLEAINRNPDYPESYINLTMMLYSTPGKRKEAEKYYKYYLTSKGFFLKRWLQGGLTESAAGWILDNFIFFKRSLELKGEILNRLGYDGDVIGYYSMMRNR